jgi:hypothetical protein
MTHPERKFPLAAEHGAEAKRHRDLVVMWLRNQAYIEQQLTAPSELDVRTGRIVSIDSNRANELVNRAQQQQLAIIQELTATLAPTNTAWDEFTAIADLRSDGLSKAKQRQEQLYRLLTSLGLTQELWQQFITDAQQPYAQGDYAVNPLADEPTITLEGSD